MILWNRTVSNLISRNDESRIVERHLVESLEPSAWLRESGAGSWLDFGSGAGYPAIPLSIAGVGPRWTLVESRRIKTLFLRKTLMETKKEGDISVLNARLESMSEQPESFIGLTARAAGKIGEALRWAGSVLQPRATAFLWKGSRWNAEMHGDRSWENEWDFVGHRPLAGEIVVLKFLRRRV